MRSGQGSPSWPFRLAPVLAIGFLALSSAALGVERHGEASPEAWVLRVARLLKGGGGAGESTTSVTSGVYEIKLTHVPAMPIAGKEVRFRVSLLDTSQKDPLLGGAVPVEDAELTAVLTVKGREGSKLKLEKEEAGVYTGSYIFPGSGAYTLTVQATTPTKEMVQGAFALEVRRDPAQVRLWTGVALALILGGGLGYLWRFGGAVRRLAQAGAAALALLVLAIAGVLVLAEREAARAVGEHAEEGHESSKGVQVPKELREYVLKTEPVALGTVHDHILANGFVEAPADRIVQVSPRVAGKVVKFFVNPGDRVEAGQVLAQIDSPQLAQAQADYLQAKARLELAEQELERRRQMASLGAFTSRPLEEARIEHARAQSELDTARSELEVALKNRDRVNELFREGIRSQRDLEVAEAAYQSSLARLRQAEARVTEARAFLQREERLFRAGFRAAKEVEDAEAEHRKARAQFESAEQALKLLHVSPSKSGGITEVASPISGVVAERKVNVGEVVEPTTVLCTVIDTRTVWVEGEVYESDLARVKEGMSVEVTVKAYPEQVFRGKVIFISRTLDPTRRTVRVRTEVKNPREELKPGMLAEVRLVTGERANVVLVPESAILDDVGRKLVYVEEGSGFVERDVKTGVSIGGKTEIKEGLKPGEIVVTRGTWELRTQLERGSGAPAVGGHGVHGAEEKPTKGAY